MYLTKMKYDSTIYDSTIMAWEDRRQILFLQSPFAVIRKVKEACNF